MNRLNLPVVLTFVLAGCANTAQLKTETPVLKFDYHTQANAPHNGRTIAITSIQFLTNNAPHAEQPDAGLLRFKLGGRALHFSAVSRYHEHYQAPLHAAMQSALAEMMAKRGFTVTGPYTSSEEIPYTDRKHLYLMILPRLNLNITQHATNESCMQGICTDTGVITLGGNFVIRFIEPLTEQTLLTKQVDLNDPGIRKNYVHQFPHETRKAVLQGLMYSDSVTGSLHDNANKQLVDAINEFYQDAIAKMDRVISAEELLSHEDSLDNIRGFRRR